MRKLLLLFVILLSAVCAWAQPVYVNNWPQLVAATSGDNPEIVLNSNIQSAYNLDKPIVFDNKNLKYYHIELNGHTLRFDLVDSKAGKGDDVFNLFHIPYGTTLTITNEKGPGYLYFAPIENDVHTRAFRNDGTLNLINVTIAGHGSEKLDDVTIENNGTAVLKGCSLTNYIGNYNSVNYFIDTKFLGNTESKTRNGLKLWHTTGCIINTTINGYEGTKEQLMSMMKGIVRIDNWIYDEKNDNFHADEPYKHIYRAETYEKDIPSVKIIALPEDKNSGTVTGSGTYKVGDVYTIEANPNATSRVAYWNVPDVNKRVSKYIGIAAASEMFIVGFESNPTYDVHAEITPDADACTVVGAEKSYFEYDPVDIKFVPKQGYRLSKVQLVDNTHNYSNIMSETYHVDHITSNMTFHVTCQKTVPFSVEPEFTYMGSVSVTLNNFDFKPNADGTADEGTQLVLMANPKLGYKFSHWSDGVFTSTRFLRVSKAVNLKACFIPVNQEASVGVQILGKNVTTSNAHDVLGDGTIRYDYINHELTLENAKLIAGAHWAPVIYVNSFDGDLTIRLIGNNYIQNSGMLSLRLGEGGETEKMNVYIEGPGQLRIHNEDNHAIWASNGTFINVTDGAYINITSGTVSGTRGLFVSTSKVYIAGLPGKNTLSGFKSVSFNGVGFNDRMKYDTTKLSVVQANGQYCTSDVLISSGTYFDASQYRLHELSLFANDDQMGYIVGGEDGFYQYGDQIQLKALPTSDKYAFLKWSDNDINSERTLTMGNKDKTLMAVFELRERVKGGFLTIKSNDEHMGTVDFGETKWYREGTKIQVSATNKYGFLFDCWSDGVTADTRNVTMGSEDMELTAIFAHPQSISYPAAVDLGLPSGTYWANVNIGAESNEEEGSYFAWGEIYPKDFFNQKGYRFLNEDGSYSKYTEESGTINYCDNAAAILWGDGWTIPAKWQFEELYDKCDVEYHPEADYALFTSKINGQVLRLTMATSWPPYGDCQSAYWESDFTTVNQDGTLHYYASYMPVGDVESKTCNRYVGRLIRPVTMGDAKGFYLYDSITAPAADKVATTSKYVKDGRIYIRRGENIYSVMGTKVK